MMIGMASVVFKYTLWLLMSNLLCHVCFCSYVLLQVLMFFLVSIYKRQSVGADVDEA